MIYVVRSGTQQGHINVEKIILWRWGNVKVTIEGEKHIYINPVKHSYHNYLSSLVIVYEICRVRSGKRQNIINRLTDIHTDGQPGNKMSHRSMTAWNIKINIGEWGGRALTSELLVAKLWVKYTHIHIHIHNNGKRIMFSKVTTT